MRKLALFGGLLLLLAQACAPQFRDFTETELQLLPMPNQLTMGKGAFKLYDSQSIGYTDAQAAAAAQSLSAFLNKKTGLSFSTKQAAAKVQFVNEAGLDAEAYTLNVNGSSVTVKASTAAGFFYGAQTLKQLVTLEAEDDWVIPAVDIKDAPRFGWRAHMLDESRYFHGKDYVKQVLDQMASLKMNIFHWHLTDDAGWRIEIKKYPKLTEIGAFRTDSEIETWGSGKLSGEPHGGFYTQEDIKEIVAYAQARQITIVPEFEIPGHSSAAIAAYTWLGTVGKAIEVPVKFGRHYDNYDITKPEVEQFVKDVLLELFALFPSEVIHIGGDEVGYEVWNKSKSVQAYMKANNIPTAADLQIHFTNKISKFIAQHGKRMMGWNEILGKNIHGDFAEKKDDKEAETDLAKNVVVHFWKGDLAMATEAAKSGYGIVNSLHSSTYLDYNHDNISVEKAYSFDPIPEGLDAQYHQNIYGLGCQMWSEWTPTNKDVERQTYPRIAAYAEVGWTQKEQKDYKRFATALATKKKEWDQLGIGYYKN